MRLSQLLAPTLREDPAEAEVVSHKLMLRAGYIRKVAAGIYTYLPLFKKVAAKIENIIREELDKRGAQEVFLPSLVPKELWQESGRWDYYGRELLRLKDRKDRDFCYGPTHEEVVVDLVRNNVKSYKELPLNLYQIQTKFRDEIRPRFGLMRGREFTMKDAYSFHASQKSLDETYGEMAEAYGDIFKRCGLGYRIVDADSGNIGGAKSQEFMILADTGEDELLYCSHCQYAANVEKAIAGSIKNQAETVLEQIKEVSTPNVKSIEEVADFFKVSPAKLIKTLIYQADEQFIMILIRGDYEVNEAKLKSITGANQLFLAHEDDVKANIGASIGFAGPITKEKKLQLYADKSIEGLTNAITGANKDDFHLSGISVDRDLRLKDFNDLRIAQQDETCPVCNDGKYKTERGIEVGHIFQLGEKYSAGMNATYLDENGRETPYIMGCYGIGVGRTAAAAIEQNHDEHGIIWPMSIAPYQVLILIANMKNTEQVEVANAMYKKLQKNGIEVLLDDRTDRLGAKFKDADLMGIPIRIIVGKKADEGIVEYSLRKNSEKKELEIDRIIETVRDEIQ
jgi:prolyl-tRNA synthetase